MPSEWAWPAMAIILVLLLVWERWTSASERQKHRDQVSELLERLHRKERMKLVAEQKPVEPELPQVEMPDPGPPPSNGMDVGDMPSLPAMTDETEAWIEQMQKQGLPQNEILRRLQGTRMP